MEIHSLQELDQALRNGMVLAIDDGTVTSKVDVTTIEKHAIETYAGSTLAGSAQSVQAALNGLDAGRFFSGGTAIASGTDLNTLTTPGVYWYHNPLTQLVNYPAVSDPGSYMTLHVFYRAIGTRMYQVLYSTTGTWYRCQQNETNWYAWKRLDNNEDAVDRLYLGPNDISIPADSDFNDYKTAGTFVVNAGSQMATMANVPVSDIGGRLDVRYILKTNAADADSAKRLFQIFTGNNPDHPQWVRFFTGSMWYPWKKNPTRAEVDALSTSLGNFTCTREVISEASTQTYTLTHSHMYLVTVARGSNADDGTAGLYVVTAYNGAGLCKTISASSLATVSINKTTLTITTTTTNVLVSIMQIA